MSRPAIDLRARIARAMISLGNKFAHRGDDQNPNIPRDVVALGSIHPTAVLYPSSSLQFQGRPIGDIDIGAHTHIRGELLLFGHGGKISIGNHCYVGEQTRIWSAKSIVIGDRVLISHCCTIMDNLTHPLDPVKRHEQFLAIITLGHPTEIDLGEKAVILEDDVLIGCHSVILRGVTVGRGAIIGAGSVVTHDVEPMTIVAGNPAKYLRKVDQN